MWQDVKQGFPGEKMFWLAVLRRSIFDYVLYKGVRARSMDWKRANKFIFGDQKHEVGLSFDEVCCLFAWEPDYIRRLTRNLNRADVRKLEARKFKDELTESFSEAPRKLAVWVPCSLFSFSMYRRPGLYHRFHILSHVPSVRWTCGAGADGPVH